MTGLKFIVFAAASLLFVEDGGALVAADGGGVATGDGTPSPGPVSPAETVSHTGKRVDCLEAMNAARTDVGLPDFKKAEGDGVTLPIQDTSASGSRSSTALRTVEPPAASPPGSATTQDKDAKEKAFLEKVCNGVLKKGTTSAQEEDLKGIYMYAAQDSGEKQCAATVEKWRGVVKTFPSTPPTYTTNESFYQNQDNLSVIGLFNPKADPRVDCAIITCQPKTSDAEASDPEANEKDSASADETTQNQGVQQSKDPAPAVSAEPSNGDELDGESVNSRASGSGGAPPSQTTPVYSLVCLSSPEVLQDNEAPLS
ncbi:hypothetical protein Emed_000897 [Eimeria media]